MACKELGNQSCGSIDNVIHRVQNYIQCKINYSKLFKEVQQQNNNDSIRISIDRKIPSVIMSASM